MARLPVQTILIAFTCVAIAHEPASGQLVNGRWQAPAKSGGSAPRTGVASSPPAKPAASSQHTTINPTPIRVIHAVQMSDGSVLADFGSGFEPVRRACPSTAANMPLRIVGGTPPAKSDSQSPLPQAPAPGLTPRAQAPTPAAQSSCYLRDAGGRTFATR